MKSKFIKLTSLSSDHVVGHCVFLWVLIMINDQMQPKLLGNKIYRKDSTGMLSLAVTSLLTVGGRLQMCFGQLTTKTTTPTTTTTLSTTTSKAPKPKVKVPTLNSIILSIHSKYLFPFPDIGTGVHLSSWKRLHPHQGMGDPSFPESARLTLLPFNL